MKRKIMVISIALVCLCMLVVFAACGANVGVETVSADEKKEIEIVANDKITITVQELTYDGWRITETVQSVKWSENGSLVTITYANGTTVITSASNYIVKIYVNEN